jgi:hypothetical protein
VGPASSPATSSLALLEFSSADRWAPRPTWPKNLSPPSFLSPAPPFAAAPLLLSCSPDSIFSLFLSAFGKRFLADPGEKGGSSLCRREVSAHYGAGGGEDLSLLLHLIMGRTCFFYLLVKNRAASRACRRLKSY